MATVIDRRAQGKNKSAANRERFMKRYRNVIKKEVEKAAGERSITDTTKEGVDISVDTITEPFFGHGNDGAWDTVIPGNEQHAKGDRLRKPKKQGGRGDGEASDGDPYEEEFTFTLTREEFADILFEDLELPDLVKKQLMDNANVEYHRAGFKTSGTASSLDIARTFGKAIGRRMVSGKARLRKLEEEYWLEENEERAAELLKEIEALRVRMKTVPFLDPIDLRYRNVEPKPVPSPKAVMFCIMDVSGSMTETTKEKAKRFFMLLHMFLSRTYETIEVVFIRHHTEAKEVTEHEFFYERETGGTKVSSALALMADIMKKRYSAEEWNVYAAQASDGDNFADNNSECSRIMRDEILPFVQSYIYIEISEYAKQGLWYAYLGLFNEFDNLTMAEIEDFKDIYPVFRDVFKKRGLT